MYLATKLSSTVISSSGLSSLQYAQVNLRGIGLEATNRPSPSFLCPSFRSGALSAFDIQFFGGVMAISSRIGSFRAKSPLELRHPVFFRVLLVAETVLWKSAFFSLEIRHSLERSNLYFLYCSMPVFNCCSVARSTLFTKGLVQLIRIVSLGALWPFSYLPIAVWVRSKYPAKRSCDQSSFFL